MSALRVSAVGEPDSHVQTPSRQLGQGLGGREARLAAMWVWELLEEMNAVAMGAGWGTARDASSRDEGGREGRRLVGKVLLGSGEGNQFTGKA